jgi:hypothetical protein
MVDFWAEKFRDHRKAVGEFAKITGSYKIRQTRVLGVWQLDTR